MCLVGWGVVCVQWVTWTKCIVLQVFFLGQVYFNQMNGTKVNFFFFWTKCNISWCGLRLRSSSGHPRWLNLFIRPERHHSLQCQLHFSPLNLSRLVLVLTSTTKAVDELVS